MLKLPIAYARPLLLLTDRLPWLWASPLQGSHCIGVPAIQARNPHHNGSFISKHWSLYGCSFDQRCTWPFFSSVLYFLCSVSWLFAVWQDPSLVRIFAEKQELTFLGPGQGFSISAKRILWLCHRNEKRKQCSWGKLWRNNLQIVRFFHKEFFHVAFRKLLLCLQTFLLVLFLLEFWFCQFVKLLASLFLLKNFFQTLLVWRICQKESFHDSRSYAGLIRTWFFCCWCGWFLRIFRFSNYAGRFALQELKILEFCLNQAGLQHELIGINHFWLNNSAFQWLPRKQNGLLSRFDGFLETEISLFAPPWLKLFPSSVSEVFMWWDSDGFCNRKTAGAAWKRTWH